VSIRALSLLLTLLLVGPGCAPRRWLSAQPLSGVAAAARRTVDGDLLIRLQIENRTGAVIEFDPAEIQVFALARGSEQRVPLWQPQEYLLELERWNQGASDLDSMLTDAELQPAHSNLGIGPDQRVNLGSRAGPPQPRARGPGARVPRPPAGAVGEAPVAHDVAPGPERRGAGRRARGGGAAVPNRAPGRGHDPSHHPGPATLSPPPLRGSVRMRP
jgi:hypothetical protein